MCACIISALSEATKSATEKVGAARPDIAVEDDDDEGRIRASSRFTSTAFTPCGSTA